jgi:hypothetical protein
MRTQHFEVVVLGGTTAAATIAALLAKRGVRGLLVDEGETTSGPADVAFADPRSSAFDLVASEIGLVRELEHERRAAAAHRVQVVFPDMRAELPIERAALLDEGARRLSAPRLGPALEALDQLEERTAAFLGEAGELPAPGFFARQRLGGVARRHAAALGDGRAALAQAGGLGEALAGLMPFLTYQDFVASEPLPALAVGRLAARFLRGLGAPPQPFGERLLEVAEKSGFERVHGAIDRLEAGAKPLRFALAKSGGALTADVLIDASTDLAGLRTISQRGRPRALGVLLEAAMPRGQLHALALELDRSVLPPPLGDFVLLLNGRKAARAGEDGAPRGRRPPYPPAPRAAAQHPGAPGQVLGAAPDLARERARRGCRAARAGDARANRAAGALLQRRPPEPVARWGARPPAVRPRARHGGRRRSGLLAHAVQERVRGRPGRAPRPGRGGRAAHGPGRDACGPRRAGSRQGRAPQVARPRPRPRRGQATGTSSQGTTAIASISTRAPRGSAATWTVARAGGEDGNAAP